jgi:hypothetical protein
MWSRRPSPEFKIGVAIMVNAGAVMVYPERTMDAYEAKTK